MVSGTAIIAVAVVMIVAASISGVDPLREVGDAFLGLGLGIIGTGLLTVADLTNQLASLKEQLEGTGQDVRSGREPIRAAAVRSGTAFVTVGSPPDSADARYLKIVDELESSADANDFSEITAALRVRHGEDASESFLLGRQLALILVPEDGNVHAETRAQVKERLGARGVDSDVIAAVDAVLRDAHDMDEATRRRHLRYTGTLLAYVSESMLTSAAKAKRSQLLRGTAGVEQAEPDESVLDSEFARLIQSLVTAGVHNRDAEVLLFHGILSNNSGAMERAMAMGADTTITDVQLMRRYRDWTPASEAQQPTESPRGVVSTLPLVVNDVRDELQGQLRDLDHRRLSGRPVAYWRCACSRPRNTGGRMARMIPLRHPEGLRRWGGMGCLHGPGNAGWARPKSVRASLDTPATRRLR